MSLNHPLYKNNFTNHCFGSASAPTCQQLVRFDFVRKHASVLQGADTTLISELLKPAQAIKLLALKHINLCLRAPPWPGFCWSLEVVEYLCDEARLASSG